MSSQRIVDEGFDNFRQGSLGNGGQNVYVSRAGVIQRIFLTSITGEGYVDLPIANSHDDNSRNPVTVFADPLRADGDADFLLPTDGAFAGVALDLTGNGYSDIVIANEYDGCSNELWAQIYFGDETGWGIKRMTKLWAPACTDVTAGRFTTGGLAELIFVSRGKLLRFVQSAPGDFDPSGGEALDLGEPVDTVAVADLDGDGVDDLVVRFITGEIRVYWGGAEGVRATDFTPLPSHSEGSTPILTEQDAAAAGAGGGGLVVSKPPTAPRLKTVLFAGRHHVFLCEGDDTVLVTFGRDRIAREGARIASGPAMSVAVADLTGDGSEDLVVATRQRVAPDAERSVIYWGGVDGWSPARASELRTFSANDVTVLRVDGDAHVVVCQDMTSESYSTESLIISGAAPGVPGTVRRIPTDCALDALVLERPSGSDALAFVNHLSNSVRGDIVSPIYLGGEDGYRADRFLPIRGWAAVEMKFVDFDDSGRPDIFVANSNENDLDVEHGSFIVRLSASATQVESIEELPTRYAMSGVVGDLNGNGYLDLVVAGFDSSTILVFHGGEHGFGEPQQVQLDADGRTHPEPRFMTLADLDNDGWLDLVIPDCGPHGATVILWGGPDGFDADRRMTLESGTAISSRVADLDGDGWPDLVIGSYKGDDPSDPYRGQVSIYWGGPEGFHPSRRTLLPASFPADLTIADFTGDGVLDIFVANYHGHRTRDVDSHIYFGEPGGQYRWENRQALPHHSACGALALDLTENGYADLLVVNHKTYGNHVGSSWIWWGSPDGLAAERRTSLPSRGPHGISHQDVGNIMDRGHEEYFVSRVIALGDPSRVTGVTVQGALPARTWVRVDVRVATAADAVEDAEWTPLEDIGSLRFRSSAGGVDAGFAQYRLWLGAWNGVNTPRIDRVELELA